MDIKEIMRTLVSEFVRPDSLAIETLPMPIETKRFLIEVGLPSGTSLEFDWKETSLGLPLLRDILSKYHMPNHLVDRYRVLGSDCGTYICFDTNDNWSLVSINEMNVTDISFVNSSVSFFVEFVASYEGILKELTSLPIHTADQITPAKAEQLRSRFASLDPRSVGDEYCYWSQVIEGLLI